MKIKFKYKEYYNFNKYGNINTNEKHIPKRIEIFKGTNLINQIKKGNKWKQETKKL